MKVKIKWASVGGRYSFTKDQIVERDSDNAERIDSLLRHGGAEVVEEPKKKVESGGESSEDSNLLHDVPIRPRGRKRSNKTDG